MSKCDLKIEFYRPDREYFTGQTVQGWVRVTVDKDIKCRDLKLNGYWQTHGRGNTARQNYEQQTLFMGEWKAGEKYEYAFEFTPPISPLTYHGVSMNIDHYVQVRADIPWSIDPKTSDEFLWRNGSLAPEAATELVTSVKSASSVFRSIGLFFAILIAIGAAVFGLQVHRLGWLGLIPALMLGLLCYRRILAEKKLGGVTWGLPATTWPNQNLSSSLTIGPIGNVSIKRVVATLTGRESVVSGSGTDRTTYNQTLFQEEMVLLVQPETPFGETLQLDPQIPIPDNDAWSVDLPDNQVIWTITMQIDISRWLDWSETRHIALIPKPIKLLENNPNPAFDSQTLHELITIASRLERCGNDTAKIDSIINNHATQLFSIGITVENTQPADSGFDDPEYANGRTIQGNLVSTGHHVRLQLPSRYNDRVDSLLRGFEWNGTGALIRWDALQKQLTILGI